MRLSDFKFILIYPKLYSVTNFNSVKLLYYSSLLLPFFFLTQLNFKDFQVSNRIIVSFSSFASFFFFFFFSQTNKSMEIKVRLFKSVLPGIGFFWKKKIFNCCHFHPQRTFWLFLSWHVVLYGILFEGIKASFDGFVEDSRFLVKLLSTEMSCQKS